MEEIFGELEKKGRSVYTEPGEPGWDLELIDLQGIPTIVGTISFYPDSRPDSRRRTRWVLVSLEEAKSLLADCRKRQVSSLAFASELAVAEARKQGTPIPKCPTCGRLLE